MSQYDEIRNTLSRRWPGWHIWYVPRANGKPVVTWHAQRKPTIEATTSEGLEEEILRLERACVTSGLRGE